MWLLFTYIQIELFLFILEIVGRSELIMQYDKQQRRMDMDNSLVITRGNR